MNDCNQSNDSSPLPASTLKPSKRRFQDSSNETKSKNRKLFQQEWLQMEDFKGWLSESSDKSKCRCICCDVEILCGKSELQKHAKGVKHQNLVMTKQKSTIISFLKAKEKSEAKEHERKVKECEIKLASFFAEHNIAFQAVDHLIPLLKSSIPDSKILKDVQMKRKKCTNIVENVIAKVETDRTVEEIKELPFSILVDESTDVTLTKFLCILVRYVSPETRRVQTKLLKLLQLNSIDCSAEEIYSIFRNFMEKNDIPMKNIIGLACDGAPVMVGKNNSFLSRLKTDAPDAVLFRCICHSAALIASRACEQLPRSTENLIREISTYVSGSCKRSAQLVEIQEFLGTEKKKILKPCSTRWLAMHQCVCRILENWSVLESFFQLALYEDKLKSAEYIVNELGNMYNKAYFLFLKYVLNFFNEFNALFQGRKPLIHQLYVSSVKLMKCVGQNFLNASALKDISCANIACPRNYLAYEEIFLGRECEELLKIMGANEALEVKKKCLQFYTTAVEEMQKRLPVCDPLFAEMQYLSPKIAFCTSRSAALKELEHLGALYKDHINLNELSMEWRILPQYFDAEEIAKLSEMDIDEMWGEIASTKSFDEELKFPNLGKLSKFILSLPHSNAEAERIFSIVNDVKNKKRNRLGDDALNGVAVTRSAFQARNVNCYEFQVTDSHLKLHNKQDLYKFEQ